MPRHRVLFSAALAAVLLSTVSGVQPADAAATASTTATATAVSPTAVNVAWKGLATPAASWFVGVATTSGGTYLGTQTVCGTCLSARFEYLAPGTSYSFTIAGFGGGAGEGVWATAAAATPSDPLCAGLAACIAIDASKSLGSLTQAGLGLNQGITERTDLSKLTALKLNYHRISAWDARSFGLARATGGEIAVMIDAAWLSWTRYTYGRNMDPWDDWETYRWFVMMLVEWHVDRNIVPEYWDIQNEPDQAPWYRGTTPPSTDRVLQQFRVAHDAIRQVLPNAKIIAPSMGTFEPVTGSYIDMRTFLKYAAGNGLRFDVISWHELGGDCGSYCDGGPRGIVQHAASVKGLLAQYPALGQPQIHINEYGDDKTYQQPGMAVGFFAAMATAGAQRGASACWPLIYDGISYDQCYANPGMADGLLLPDGRTPTAKWFVWQAFSKMTGTVVASNVARPDASVLAVKASNGTIRVLAGRHATTASAPAITTFTVRIKVPSSTRSYSVTSNAVTPISTTEKINGLGNVRVSNGVLDLGTFTVANGSSLSFTLVPR